MRPAPLAPEIALGTHGKLLGAAPGVYPCDLEHGKPAIVPWILAEWELWLFEQRGLRLDDFPSTTLTADRPYRMRSNFYYADPTPGAPVCSYHEPWEVDHQMVMVGKWRPPMRSHSRLRAPRVRAQLSTWYRLSFPVFLLRSLCSAAKGKHTRMETMFAVNRKFTQGFAPSLQLLQEAYSLRYLMQLPSYHLTYWLKASGQTALKNAVTACQISCELGPRGGMTEVGIFLYRGLANAHKELGDASVIAMTVGLLGIPHASWRPEMANDWLDILRTNPKKYGERQRLAMLFALYCSVPVGAATTLNKQLSAEIRRISFRVLLEAYGRGIHRMLARCAAWSALFLHLDSMRVTLEATTGRHYLRAQLRDLEQ